MTSHRGRKTQDSKHAQIKSLTWRTFNKLPFLSSLIQEIENAFDIPHHLKGFTVLDPNSISSTVHELNEFGGDGIESLAHFYSRTSNENPAVIDPDALPPQYQAYKMFVLKKRIDYETKQIADLSKISMCLNKEKSKPATLSNILLKRKKNQN